ncbi:MAG: heme exporter protein CcmD [Panacagrimonas sp.]
MSELLNMGGYGNFVWGSFGVAVAVYVWNLWSVRLARRATIARILELQAEESEGRA